MEAGEEKETKGTKAFEEAIERLKEPEETPLKEKKEEKVEKEETAKEKPKLSGSMDLKQTSELAKEQLAEALNKKANATISISQEGEGFLALIEMVDEEYLPGQDLESMNDILGVYEVKLSIKGELLSWSRKSSRKRGDTDRGA